MKESRIQRKIGDMLKGHGFWPLKLTVVAMRGFPDLLVLGHGRVFFIEVKQPGKKLRANQRLRQRQIRSHGLLCEWFDSVDEAEQWLTDTVLRDL